MHPSTATASTLPAARHLQAHHDASTHLQHRLVLLVGIYHVCTRGQARQLVEAGGARVG